MLESTTEPNKTPFREAHLRDYWKVVWEARWTVAAIFFVIVGVTAVWTFLQTPVYRATATVEVQPQANRVAAGRDVSGLGVAGYGWFAEEKYHNTQIEIIQSRDLARRVVEALNLQRHPKFAETTDPVEMLRRRVRAIPRRDTGLIEISISGTEPDEITQWANEVARQYVDRNIEKARENVHYAIDTIKVEMEKLGHEFKRYEKQRLDTLQDTQLGSEDRGDIVRDKIKTYNAELTELQIELNRLRDTLGQVRRIQQKQGDLMSIPQLAEDPNLKELNRTKIELERKLEARKVELRPGHPEYERTVSELAKVQQRIQDGISVMLGTLQNEYSLAQAQEQYLADQIARAESQSLEVAQGISDYNLAKTQADVTKQVFDLIASTVNEVQVGLQLMTNNVSLLDEATPPLYPVKPRRKVNLLIGAFLGLFLGVATAFFLDYLDNTFRSPDDIEKYLGLSVLGLIPRIRAGEGVSARAVKEAYQSLRTSIIFSSKNHRRRVILFTSTSPQEGKSSTVAHLGRMLATAGDRVMIADCDLRRPVQHQFHNVDRDPGVTNYLAAPIDRPGPADGSSWSVYAKPGEVNNLQLLTSGPIPPSPPELLGSERFGELIAQLRESYDWVLVDSPPAATLADARVLASACDMVVVVVQHGQADRDLVAKTIQRLRAVNPNVAGAVLNNVDLERAYHRDYYYAGAYYYTDGGERRTRKGEVESQANVG